MYIDLSHGSGGKQTSSLIHDIFLKHFDNETLNKLEDAAVLDIGGRIAYTTDSFVVTPMFFRGGNIGKLAVCGTVNDLSMMGAKPKYLTAGFIIEAGTDMNQLDQIAQTMKEAALEAGVKIVAGDTKVIEGSGNVYINTSGIGEILKEGVSIQNCRPKDAILLSGNLGEHHAAIMSGRMGIENTISSDCAPLSSIVADLLKNGIDVHCMRDATRGGLATVLNEVSESSHCRVEIDETSIPISREVKGFCDILGLDPLYMANEGKMIAVVPGEQAEAALAAMQQNKYGENARIIGDITEGAGVYMTTALHGRRIIDILYGEGLPRIC
ncbi:hydrogenase expression/formation protein HypE [Muricomes intestini]|jgi:hydrogenase expression/formation protein HypE|uniref:Hydrogenase expression/formation protein HypE n=1 Tax=Muricomes intestini TaxID=1796634 RepID=A0A4R3KCB7_9FIRM|nr:hydrogenase expression/formation protein HypE [Muricomes intestini]TCS80757.1 hydrogenase expression/formation protein HypE [Muricomes intestini]HAX53538.1 hydrogenase expression/formation protein HypE [Lachnospiraceae bacterium]